MSDKAGIHAHAAHEKAMRGRNEMIVGQLELSALTREARKLLPNDDDYRHWLEANGLKNFTEIRAKRKYRFIDVPGGER